MEQDRNQIIGDVFEAHGLRLGKLFACKDFIFEIGDKRHKYEKNLDLQNYN